MLKKVLAGSFLLLVIGALVAGGISLLNRSQDAHAWQGRGRDERSVAARGADDPFALGSQGAGAWARTDEALSGGGYGRGQGQGNAQPSRVQPQAGVADWQMVEGIVLRDPSGRPMWAGRGRRSSAVSYTTQTQ